MPISFSPSIDTSFAWFLQHATDPLVKYEGDAARQGNIVRAPFRDVIKAYREAGHPMMGVFNNDGTIYGLNINRIYEYHDARVAENLQGKETVVTFSQTYLACLLTLSVGELTSRLQKAGHGECFIQLESANRFDEGRTVEVLNFANCLFEAAEKGGTAIFTPPTRPHPHYVPQTPDQINAALASGIPFATVPLPAAVGTGPN